MRAPNPSTLVSRTSTQRHLHTGTYIACRRNTARTTVQYLVHHRARFQGVLVQKCRPSAEFSLCGWRRCKNTETRTKNNAIYHTSHIQSSTFEKMPERGCFAAWTFVQSFTQLFTDNIPLSLAPPPFHPSLIPVQLPPLTHNHIDFSDTNSLFVERLRLPPLTDPQTLSLQRRRKCHSRFGFPPTKITNASATADVHTASAAIAPRDNFHLRRRKATETGGGVRG